MEPEDDPTLRARLEAMTTPRLRSIAACPPSGGWRPEAIALAARILAERGEVGEPLLGCPACGGELHAGQLSIRGTLAGFLMAGFGYKHLWFRPEDGGKAEVVLHQVAPPRSASRCGDCGLILFEGA